MDLTFSEAMTGSLVTNLRFLIRYITDMDIIVDHLVEGKVFPNRDCIMCTPMLQDQVLRLVERIVKRPAGDYWKFVSCLYDESLLQGHIAEQILRTYEEQGGDIPPNAQKLRKKYLDEMQPDGRPQHLPDPETLPTAQASVAASVQKKPEPKPEPKKPEANKPKHPEEGKTFYRKVCIFCGEHNEAFTEESLDIHYWKSCLMLTRCTSCKQVVETANLTDHVLMECKDRTKFGKCPRCTEAIPYEELDQHLANQTCNSFKWNMNHCPLCHENLPKGEEGWKDHLMSQDGCKENPRRLPQQGEITEKERRQTGGDMERERRQTRGDTEKERRWTRGGNKGGGQRTKRLQTQHGVHAVAFKTCDIC